MELDFLEKFNYGDNTQKHDKNSFFSDFVKNSPLMCRFLGFKSCIKMTCIILLKLQAWEKSGQMQKWLQDF